MQSGLMEKVQQCHLEELLLEILLVEFSEFPAKQVSTHTITAEHCAVYTI